MDIEYKHDKKLCTVWLTNAEKNDTALRESLKPLYASNKAKGYLTAVYESGSSDLYMGTIDLLKYNRRKLAEMEVIKERESGAKALER